MGNPEALSNQLAPNDPTFRLQLLNFMQSPNYPNHTSIPEALVSACVAAGQDGRSVCQLPKKGTSDGTSSPCHKRYSRPDRLRDHLNSHLQVKPYLHEGTSLVCSLVQLHGAYPKTGYGSRPIMPAWHILKGTTSLGLLVISGRYPSLTRCHEAK
jgi:hypothetical protein